VTLRARLVGAGFPRGSLAGLAARRPRSIPAAASATELATQNTEPTKALPTPNVRTKLASRRGATNPHRAAPRKFPRARATQPANSNGLAHHAGKAAAG
jgi:hypothetical protein